MISVVLTELAQRRELLKMARPRDLVGDRPELPPIEPAARDGRLPLSFAYPIVNDRWSMEMVYRERSALGNPEMRRSE